MKFDNWGYGAVPSWTGQKLGAVAGEKTLTSWGCLELSELIHYEKVHIVLLLVIKQIVSLSARRDTGCFERK